MAGLLVVSTASAVGFERPERRPPTTAAPAPADPADAVDLPSDAIEAADPPGDATAEPGPGWAREPDDAGPEPGSAPEPRAGTPTTTVAGGRAAATADRPRPGVYRYLVDIDDEDDVTRLEVRDAGGDRLEVTDRDQGQTDRVRWQPAAVTVETTRWEDGGTCDWRPDLTVLRFPLAPGSSWSAEGGCTVVEEDGSTTMHVASTWRVVRSERVEVAAMPVDVWVVEQQVATAVTWTYEGERGSYRVDERATIRFSPAHGLAVSTEVVRRRADEPGTPDEEGYEEREHRRLMSLDPAPR